MVHLKYLGIGFAAIALFLLTAWGVALAYTHWPFPTALVFGLALMAPAAYGLGRTFYDAYNNRGGKP